MGSMPLSHLLEPLPGAEIDGDPGLAVSGVACDSRRVRPGWLFAALRGHRRDGHLFLDAALAAGARAVLSAEPRGGRAPAAVWVQVADDRRALARVARRFHGDPDLRLALAGITGTKGKTTTAWLLESMVEAGGGRAGGSGTVRVRVGEREEPADLTTPDAPALCALLARMVEAGCTHAVVEVSSQALDQRRVDALRFRCAIFTGLGRDHLDYHGSMDAYLEAKSLLFLDLERDAVAVLPAADPASDALARLTRARIVRYTADPRGSSGRFYGGAPADVSVESADLSLEGTAAVLRTPQGAAGVRTPLVGRHNLHNLAAAAAAACGLGLGPAAIAEGAARVRPVPGRLERIDEGQPYLVFVDYAHTEDALRRTLESLRELVRGRLLCVFGCGGDRDPGKRAPMGAAAAALADLLFLTSDNPRTEDPLLILREVESGVRSAAARRPYQIIPERARAIAAALAEAGPGDAVLVAGKGHEREQILGERRVPFDDREECRRLLRGRAGAGTRRAPAVERPREGGRT